MGKQKFKSVYYSDHPAEDSKGKAITLAFNEPEVPYYSKVNKMSNEEIRELIGIDSYRQLALFAEEEDRSINQVVKRLIKKNLKEDDNISAKDVTFAGSKEIPFQRWYPFIEGYSPDFVLSLINYYNLKNNKKIFDPFAGTGTTIFAADTIGINTIYSEINPLLQFLIQTKVATLQSPEKRRAKLSSDLKKIAAKFDSNYLNNFKPDYSLKSNYDSLFNSSIYFEREVFGCLLCIRSFIDIIKFEDELLANIITIAILASLIPASKLKKAGDVRFKTKKELKKQAINLFEFVSKKITEMSEDILNMDFVLNTNPDFILSNSKNVDLVNELKIDTVITSPPYLNGTNYFRNTKLELWFLRYIQTKKDLRYFRDKTLTSGINDVRSGNQTDDHFIAKKSDLLEDCLTKLEKVAYDKRIPKMVRDYFEEMDCIFSKLTKHLVNGSKIFIDIGDSIYANVHIPTDEILKDVLKRNNYKFVESKLLRKRRSRNKEILSQTLLVFVYDKIKQNENTRESFNYNEKWENFKTHLPHQKPPYSKRNWGHYAHSLCSYQGKLKPSIAYHLVNTFVPEGGKILDPFSGVGTIPFEASLNGKTAYGIDISIPAYYISYAKVSHNSRNNCFSYINEIQDFINSEECKKEELDEVNKFGFNKTISEYYEENTLQEVILARRFIKQQHPPENSSEMMVISALLHILHGNRPYALSRRSHPIVPYAPKGEFIYKSLIKSLTDKVNRTLKAELPLKFKQGKIFNQDSTSIWPQEINNLDAIITSPPFFDSTRFYLANWIRLWFAGWSEKDFKYQINSFIEEKQKTNFKIYENIFRQARERLKKNGVLVLHLGKSKKCNMAKELKKVSDKWFKVADLFDESVAHCESHGIRDKGSVTSHQYLVLH
jgi:tRNA G10  N-methylase Trm11